MFIYCSRIYWMQHIVGINWPRGERFMSVYLFCLWPAHGSQYGSSSLKTQVNFGGKKGQQNTSSSLGQPMFTFHEIGGFLIKQITQNDSSKKCKMSINKIPKERFEKKKKTVWRLNAERAPSRREVTGTLPAGAGTGWPHSPHTAGGGMASPRVPAADTAVGQLGRESPVGQGGPRRAGIGSRHGCFLVPQGLAKSGSGSGSGSGQLRASGADASRRWCSFFLRFPCTSATGGALQVPPLMFYSSLKTWVEMEHSFSTF